MFPFWEVAVAPVLQAADVRRLVEIGALRGENTRQEIIKAAHDLFIHQGFHGTSMRQVARQSGIALGSQSNHFPSKGAVFEGVFLTYHPYQTALPCKPEKLLDTWVRMDRARQPRSACS